MNNLVLSPLTWIILSLCGWTLTSWVRPLLAQVEVQPRMGVSFEKPRQGDFVQGDDEYLLPYKANVPSSRVSFEMIPLPGGTFTMGSPPEEPHRAQDEGPQHPIRVVPFWIGKHEVTWGEYRQFMELYDLFKERNRQTGEAVKSASQADAITAPTPLYDPTFTFSLGEKPRHPAVTMTEYAARQYTKWLSLASGDFYRLPTEAEWEYACRAGSRKAYSFGGDKQSLEKFAWYFDNSDDMYQEVGQKLPNSWGLCDMHGNVAEMVLDQYAAEAYQENSQRPNKGPLSTVDALRWPTKMFGRVIRGGSWNSDAEQLRCAARSQSEDWRSEDPNFPKSPWWYTDEQAQSVGFRLVRAYEVPPVEEQGKYWDADTDELQGDIDHRLGEGRGVLGVVKPEGE